MIGRLRAVVGGGGSAGEARRLGRLMVLPAMIVSGLLVFYPLVKGFSTSLHTGGVGSQPSQFVGFQNYSDGLRDPATGTSIIHTGFYVLIALVMEVVGGMFIAVTMHRVFRGRGIVLAILILPWALPSVVSGLLWRRIFDPNSGILNHLLLDLHVIHDPQVWFASPTLAIPFITLVHAWGVIPLVTLIFLAGLQAIPDEVYSASAVDGATPFRQFRHITLPLLLPSVAIAMTVGTVAAINIFDEIFVLNGTALNTRSIVTQVYNTTFVQANFSTGTALAFLVAGITALFGVLYAIGFRRSTV